MCIRDRTNREDYIPARTDGGAPMGPVMDALDADEDDGFELGTGQAAATYAEGDGFELGRAGSTSDAQTDAQTADAKTEAARTVDDPRSTTDGAKTAENGSATSESKPAEAEGFQNCWNRGSYPAASIRLNLFECTTFRRQPSHRPPPAKGPDACT